MQAKLHPSHPPLRRNAVTGALLALLLGACGPAVKQDTPPTAKPATQQVAPAVRLPLGRKGSEEYLSMARSAPTPRREEYQLLAAGALIDEGRIQEAAQLAGVIQTAPLGDELRRRKALILGRISLARGDGAALLKRLPTPGPNLSDGLRAEIHDSRAQAYRALGNELEAARERIALEPLLADREAVEANRRAIFATLDRLTPTALETFTLGPPDLLSGWLELVAAHKRAGADRDRLDHQLSQWRLRYPRHPGSAMGGGEADVSAIQPALDYPDTIALLLPLSGRLSEAGGAVRDGLLAAYYRGREAGINPRIRLYDTAGDAGAIWSHYGQALADGARAIIGPLDKGAVSALALTGEVDVPLLALNHVDEITRGGFYQFSLSPEDEARSVAMRAQRDGYRRALVLTPEGEWGDRVAAAFTEHWEGLDNDVVEQVTYNPAENDFAQPIQALLDLDQSELRYRALRSTIHRTIEFETRRREDADLIFLAGFPRQTRLIRPQLRFHQAADMALYTTSHVFGGRINPDADRDMDGLVFCDMPWSLPESRGEERTEVEALWPEGMSRYARLYAMGMDAYRLIPYLNRGGSVGAQPLFEGVTGNLRLEAGNRIHRELRCARFIDGVPVSLTPPDDESATVAPDLLDVLSGESDVPMDEPVILEAAQPGSGE